MTSSKLQNQETVYPKVAEETSLLKKATKDDEIKALEIKFKNHHYENNKKSLEFDNEYHKMKKEETQIYKLEEMYFFIIGNNNGSKWISN